MSDPHMGSSVLGFPLFASTSSVQLYQSAPAQVVVPVVQPDQLGLRLITRSKLRLSWQSFFLLKYTYCGTKFSQIASEA